MIKINNIDYSKNAVYPIKIQLSRDEGLDVGIFTLKNLSSGEPFEPSTKVLIDDETFLVAKDEVRQTIFGKKPKWEHIIYLVEETKELEKYFVDNCTVTNSLIEYSVDINPAIPKIEMARDDYPEFNMTKSTLSGIVTDYVSPRKTTGDNFDFVKFNNLFNNHLGSIFVSGIYSNRNLGRMKIIKDGNIIHDTGDIQSIDRPEHSFRDRKSTRLNSSH